MMACKVPCLAENSRIILRINPLRAEFLQCTQWVHIRAKQRNHDGFFERRGKRRITLTLVVDVLGAAMNPYQSLPTIPHLLSVTAHIIALLHVADIYNVVYLTACAFIRSS